MARNWRRWVWVCTVAFMLPLTMMGPAWAGRFGFHRCRLRRCRAACRMVCRPVVVCPPVECESVACVCGSCAETVAIEHPEAAIATDSVVAKPVAPQDHTPAPMPEPVPRLQPAVVAPASAEEPAPKPAEPRPPEPTAPEEPEMKPEPTTETKPDTKPEVTPEPETPTLEPKPEPKPEPAPALEVKPAPAPDVKPAPEVPAPDVKPEPKPEPPVEKNIFEDVDDESEQPMSDEDGSAEPADEGTEPSDEPATPAGDDEPAEMPAKPEDEKAPSESEGDDPFAAHVPMPVEPMRRWIDDTGNHATVGRLVEVHPDRVRILKLNGAHTTVSLDRLSSADRNYVAATGERIAAKPRVTDTAGL